MPKRPASTVKGTPRAPSAMAVSVILPDRIGEPVRGQHVPDFVRRNAQRFTQRMRVPGSNAGIAAEELVLHGPHVPPADAVFVAQMDQPEHVERVGHRAVRA